MKIWFSKHGHAYIVKLVGPGYYGKWYQACVAPDGWMLGAPQRRKKDAKQIAKTWDKKVERYGRYAR